MKDSRMNVVANQPFSLRSHFNLGLPTSYQELKLDLAS